MSTNDSDDQNKKSPRKIEIFYMPLSLLFSFITLLVTALIWLKPPKSVIPPPVVQVSPPVVQIPPPIVQFPSPPVVQPPPPPIVQPPPPPIVQPPPPPIVQPPPPPVVQPPAVQPPPPPVVQPPAVQPPPPPVVQPPPPPEAGQENPVDKVEGNPIIIYDYMDARDGAPSRHQKSPSTYGLSLPKIPIAAKAQMKGKEILLHVKILNNGKTKMRVVRAHGVPEWVTDWVVRDAKNANWKKGVDEFGELKDSEVFVYYQW